ncbi:MAG: peptidase MA family metallohydrolase [bacterium]
MAWLVGLALLALAGPVQAQATDLETARTTHYVFEWSPGLAGTARALREQVEGHHARIYGELGVEASEPTRVTLLRDEAAMLEEAAARHGGRPPPHWAEGLAYPATREIFLHAGQAPGALDVTLQHEISHVAVGHFKHAEQLPTWFMEGLAIRQSEGFALERAWLLTEAATFGNLLGLDELAQGFPAAGGQRVGIAYAQSVHFVGWLQSTHGTPAFQRFLARAADGMPFNAALEASFGQTAGELEQAWRRSLEVFWGWIPIIFGSTTLWAVATVLLVIGWRRRRRLQLARFARLQAREAAELADDIAVVGRPRPPGDTTIH